MFDWVLQLFLFPEKRTRILANKKLQEYLKSSKRQNDKHTKLLIDTPCKARLPFFFLIFIERLKLE